MDPNDALRMIKRRVKVVGLPEAVCNHTFRATGITTFRANGGTLDVSQPYCLLRQRYPGFPLLRRVSEM
jgi:hypothetical protein